jgi:hypothetical protein
VIIEREADGGYIRQHHDFASVSWIDVSVPPGNYRYRIIPYNFLNRPGEGSQWMHITVRPALNPGVDTILSDILYLDERAEYVLITIVGKNIELDAEIELRRSDGVSVVPYAKNISDDSSNVDLFFTREQLSPGTYEVYIRNLSGLETRGREISIAYPEVTPKPLAVVQEDPVNADGPTPAREESDTPASGAADMVTVGASLGTTFAAPLLIVTVRETIAFFANSFLEIGLDFGIGSAKADVNYFSLCPFVHYAFFLPFAKKIDWYAGAGGGFMLAQYNFPEGDVPSNTFIVDFVTGINLMNFIDISYTIRTNFKGANHKLSVGYTYRFN